MLKKEFRTLIRICLTLSLFCFWESSVCSQEVKVADQLFEWQLMDSLPAEGASALGLGGAFSGVHKNAYIIAGGTNFPDSMPWQGGKKAWYEDIYVLLKNEDGSFRWHEKQYKLPGGPRAYGVSVSTENGVLCIGGQSAGDVFADVLVLKWNPALQRIEFDSLPALAMPLTMMSGTLIGHTVYLAGGRNAADLKDASKTFLSYDLSQNPQNASWKSLEPWPGPGRILSVSVTQNNGLDDCFYLFSGLNTKTGEANEYLTDAYTYNPKTNVWKRLTDIPDYQGKPRSVIAAPAMAFGKGHILLFGGVSGQVNIPLERLAGQINELKQEDEILHAEKIEDIRRKRARVYENHPGFPKDILQYHTITDAWSKLGELPFNAPVGTSLLPWGDLFVLGSGEIYPGIRSSKIYGLSTKAPHSGLSFLNISVLVLYFLALIWMGFKFSKTQKNEDDYFKGGGRIPWWAAALSLFGTGLSAITFMAVPAKTFATDWAYYLRVFPLFLVPLLVNWLFIPFYRKLSLTTAYEYLQLRFNLATRLLASLSFLIFQLGRIAVVLFLPSVAINVVSGMDIYVCILLMGGISLVYTLMGGIEAVIWTDVMQVIVLMGGGILCLFLITAQVDGGFSGIINYGTSNEKFEILNLAFDFTQPTFWVVVIGGFFSNLIVYSSDQTMVQRYLTTSDTKGAQRSLWTSIFISIVSGTLFFFMGTALFAFFKEHPAELLPGMASTDAVFPWYIISQLPDGVSGLLIAGIFAAAMSSLSSSMNSAATAYTIDFHRLFQWKGDGLRVGRIATLVFGIAGTLFAILLASTDVKSIWDEFLKIVGLITGGLGGVFMLGIISSRANGVGAMIGLLLSGVIQYWMGTVQPVHLLLFTATGFVSCMLIGYFASLLFPAANKPIKGLTIYS